MVPDAREDPRFADHPAVTVEDGVRFYAAAPLVATIGHALGTLCVVDSEPRRLGAEQLQALRALGRQVTAQFELRRYAGALAGTTARLQELERRKDELAGLVGGELRAPLRLMDSYLEALGRTGHHDAELADLVGRACAAHVRGMRDLLGHLGSMADAGRRPGAAHAADRPDPAHPARGRGGAADRRDQARSGSSTTPAARRCRSSPIRYAWSRC